MTELAVTALPRGIRDELPKHRMLETRQFVHDNQLYTVGLGRRPGHTTVDEVFLTAGKDGSSLGTMAKDAAIILSLAIQYGCPIEVIRHAVLRNPNNTPAGPIGCVLDMIEREPVAS